MNKEKKKVVIYGIGMNFEIFMKYVKLEDIEIIALIDKNKCGMYWNNLPIKHPDELRTLKFDEIYLLIKENEGVINYLVYELHINHSQIRSTYELNQKYLINEDLRKYRYVMFTDAQYYLNYPYLDLNNRTEFVMKGVLAQNEEWKFDKISYDDKIIFIFRDHYYHEFKEMGLVPYIRYKFPKSKLVLLMSDMCEGEFGRLKVYGNTYTTDIKKIFDLIITYHSKDAEKYGFIHYCQTYPLHISQGITSYDVLFVGRSKNRLEILHKIFRYLKNNGVTCRFWITDVDKKEQLNDPDITYNIRLPYEDYLIEVGKCRCILEICQIGDEATYRYAEAIINNKKLIVNDEHCKNRKYYSNEFIQCIKRPEDISCSWIKKRNTVDYKYENDFSPDKFLKFLEEKFEI